MQWNNTLLLRRVSSDSATTQMDPEDMLREKVTKTTPVGFCLDEGLRVVTFVNRELRRGCQLLRNGTNREPAM